jgi:hypothetical protein
MTARRLAKGLARGLAGRLARVSTFIASGIPVNTSLPVITVSGGASNNLDFSDANNSHHIVTLGL